MAVASDIGDSGMGNYGGFWDSLPKAPMDIGSGGSVLLPGESPRYSPPDPNANPYQYQHDWDWWRQQNPSNPIYQPQTSTPTGGQNVSVDQLKQIIGNDWSTGHLQQVLPQLQALGIEVQNQQRGDLRPRFRLPSGEVFDFGPGGWVPRGQMSPGFGDPSQAPSGSGGMNASGMSGLGAGQAQSMGDFFHNLPGYQFTLGEGLNAIQRGAASKGTLLTGGTQKALEQYATGLADTTMGNWIDRYLNASKLGLSATGAGT